jgi:hypothetical protein
MAAASASAWTIPRARKQATRTWRSLWGPWKGGEGSRDGPLVQFQVKGGGKRLIRAPAPSV